MMSRLRPYAYFTLETAARRPFHPLRPCFNPQTRGSKGLVIRNVEIERGGGRNQLTHPYASTPHPFDIEQGRAREGRGQGVRESQWGRR